MDLEKFTERSRGFLQAAQTLALRSGHQRLTPEHLLKVLLDDKDGLAAGLLRNSGADPARAGRDRKGARQAAEGRRSPAPVRSIWARTGASSTRRRSWRRKPATASVTAERAAARAGLDQRRRHRPDTQDAGATAQGLNAAINEVRQGSHRAKRERRGQL
jgi:ATP-dependent Clp protease ATP-binding subunit ClpB